MKRRWAILLLCGACGLQAEEPAPSPDGSSRANFAERMMRDPFWPIHYKPGSSAPGRGDSSSAATSSTDPVYFSSLSPEEQAMIRRNMVVGGVLRRGTAYIAYINNTVVRAGELLTLSAGGRNYVFRVRAISDNRVDLEPYLPEAEEQTESP